MMLTDNQQHVVEANMGLVGKVIKDKVHGLGQEGAFTYDDLFQIGCIGLCKAAATDKGGCFSTYAYRLIWNEICDALVKTTRINQNETIMEACDIMRGVQECLPDPLEACELNEILKAARSAADGVTAKGIQCLMLSAQGYDLDFSYKEISDKLQISIYKAHERMINALRKLRDPKYFDLIRYGLKATVREMIRLESECGFQDGFNRGIEERWEDINEETGEMNVPESLHNCMNGITIEDLQLSVRVSKCLRRNKVETLVDLLQMQDKDLLAINNLGKSALKDIRRKQNEYIKNLLVEMVADEVVVLRTREEDFQTQGGIR